MFLEQPVGLTQIVSNPIAWEITKTTAQQQGMPREGHALLGSSGESNHEGQIDLPCKGKNTATAIVRPVVLTIRRESSRDSKKQGTNRTEEGGEGGESLLM